MRARLAAAGLSTQRGRPAAKNTDANPNLPGQDSHGPHQHCPRNFASARLSPALLHRRKLRRAFLQAQAPRGPRRSSGSTAAAALDPLLETLHELSQRIEALDKDLLELAKFDELPLRLQTVPGVGPIVCLAFIAWMDRPERFGDSRDVGACLGLRPCVRDSRDRISRGRITREGDGEMRRLLVQAAHAALHCRKDSALKRWALRGADRSGKKKAHQSANRSSSHTGPVLALAS